MPGARLHLLHRSRGAALITALVLLIVVTLLTVTAMRFSTLELRMAGNEQQRLAAFESAQAAIDSVIADTDNFPIIGAAGFTNCTANLTSCSRNDITLSGAPFDSTTHFVTVARLPPDTIPIPRGVETSSDKFSAAAFSVNSFFDGSGIGTGSVRIVQGYLVLAPKSNQSN